MRHCVMRARTMVQSRVNPGKRRAGLVKARPSFLKPEPGPKPEILPDFKPEPGPKSSPKPESPARTLFFSTCTCKPGPKPESPARKIEKEKPEPGPNYLSGCKTKPEPGPSWAVDREKSSEWHDKYLGAQGDLTSPRPQDAYPSRSSFSEVGCQQDYKKHAYPLSQS